MFFSVIIPTLNEENYLPKILADFAKQEFKNFEIIIVDANSEDKTREKALGFSKNFPFQFYSVGKRNVSCQRNFGAKKAQGEYLLFLDADAEVNTKFTEDLYKNILKTKGLLLLPTLTNYKDSKRNKILFKAVNSIIEASQSSVRQLSPGGSIFINRKLFFDLNGFRENIYIGEDHNLVQRARKSGVKAQILKDIKVVFSLRRVEEEGEAIVLYKYLLAWIHMIVNGEVTNKIFKYEMGGKRYRGAEDKTLSIIVPTLNEEKYLPILLSSLAGQTNKKFEVIISDGKSEDKTKEKALEFKDNLNIKIYDSNKKHLAYQRNFGAQKAKGDYLVFIDADCRVDKNFVEVALEEIKKTDADLIIPMIVWGTKKLFWKAHNEFQNFLAPFTIFFKKPLANGSAVIIKKSFFEKIGGYDESVFVYEDQYLLQVAIKNKAKFYYSKKIKVYSSMRRIEKSGTFNYFYDNILAGFHLVFFGPVKKRLYKYEMGGQAHEN